MSPSATILAVLAGSAVVYLLWTYWSMGSGGITLGAPSQFVKDLADSIAVAEGYGIDGAIPTRANNPGDLTDVGQNFPGDTGQRIGQNIIVFATPTDGFNALYNQINLWLSGNSGVVSPDDSIEIIAHKYAPDNPIAWAANVSAQLSARGYNAGIQTPLSQIQAVSA